jgi:hypothetical protein
MNLSRQTWHEAGMGKVKNSKGDFSRLQPPFSEGSRVIKTACLVLNKMEGVLLEATFLV